RVAPVQVVIIPVAQHKEGVLEKAEELRKEISAFARVKLDGSDKKPGWKFSEEEMNGVPIRLEVGPKDIENNQVVLVRRDTREKTIVSMDELEEKIVSLLNEILDALYEKAANRMATMTSEATTFEALKENAETKPGFIRAMWCGKLSCEEKIKEEAGLSSRCMPFEQEAIADTCVCCGEKAEKLVVWGKSY
ncbi:MAG TPA: His/Gly/Thr/Pro-type tRNA ligase C-terminal domain-containing protein, partial [Clostridiaceae bacterium]|nr:His/Gly/Thr/Pro-type tRNA ligase C-terminal domain-containing protein [Clostridiaceae bacterium]